MPEGPIKDYILFPQDSSNPGAIDAEHPFISTVHASTHTSSLKSLLLELAVVLLELWHNTSFETFCQSKNKTIPAGDEYYERHALVYRWFDETKEDLVGRHQRAVGFCLRCVSKDADFGNRQFRNEMFDGVLSPLLQNASV